MPQHGLGLATVSSTLLRGGRVPVSVCFMSGAARRHGCSLDLVRVRFLTWHLRPFVRRSVRRATRGTCRDRVCRNIEMRRTICFDLPVPFGYTKLFSLHDARFIYCRGIVAKMADHDEVDGFCWTPSMSCYLTIMSSVSRSRSRYNPSTRRCSLACRSPDEYCDQSVDVIMIKEFAPSRALNDTLCMSER